MKRKHTTIRAVVLVCAALMFALLPAVTKAENENSVYYHSNGGEGGAYEEGRYTAGSAVTIPGNSFSRPGYRFIGWSENPGGPTSRQPGDTFEMPGGSVDFYAQWQQGFYIVEYYVTGGTLSGLNGDYQYARYTGLAYGDALPQPDDPYQAGYTFDGWSAAIPETVPEGGLVVYGSMTELPPIAQSDEEESEYETIVENQIPLAGPSWALVNLILTVVTALASAWMLLGLARGGEDKRVTARLLTLVPAIGATIAFVLTERMKNTSLGMTDRWTVLMAGIAVVQAVLIVLALWKKKPSE